MFDRHHHFSGRRGAQFGRGDLKYVILDLISEKPRHGYDIIRALEEYSHGFYAPSPGVVYPTLQLLEEMGQATVEQRDGKKVYTITVGRTMNRFRRLGATVWRRAPGLSKEQIKRIGEVLTDAHRQIEAIPGERGDDDKEEDNGG